MSTNPLLDKLRIPGETFPLPSRGLFYNNGELSEDVVNGEIHVLPMTTYEEIVMRSPDLVYSGKAINQVFGRCIPQVLKPMQLLAKDVDYLLACLRAVTYGNDIKSIFDHGCADKEQMQEHEFNLRQLIAGAKQVDPTSLSTKFTLVFDNGQEIKLKPATYEKTVELDQLLYIESEGMTEEELTRSLISMTSNVIASIDGIEDRNMIQEWMHAIPAGMNQQIKDKSPAIADWGLDLNLPVTCKYCGEETHVEVSTNPLTFFFDH